MIAKILQFCWVLPLVRDFCSQYDRWQKVPEPWNIHSVREINRRLLRHQQAKTHQVVAVERRMNVAKQRWSNETLYRTLNLPRKVDTLI